MAIDERASQRASLGSGEVEDRYKLERHADPTRFDGIKIEIAIERGSPPIPRS